jgi:hypothetical protein
MQLMFFKSSKVKLIEDLALMFNCSMPKYTDEQPALMAAVSDSYEPTGAKISAVGFRIISLFKSLFN